jgi:hypothetical protein
MNCWHCKHTAVGSCRFCGRGICEDHVKIRPYILELIEGDAGIRALVVDDALHCGACHPRPNPLLLPELD